MLDDMITKEEVTKPLKGKIQKPKVLLDDGEIQNNLDQIGKMMNYKIIEKNYDQIEFKVKLLMATGFLQCLLACLYLVYHQNRFGFSDAHIENFATNIIGILGMVAMLCLGK